MMTFNLTLSLFAHGFKTWTRSPFLARVNSRIFALQLALMLGCLSLSSLGFGQGSGGFDLTDPSSPFFGQSPLAVEVVGILQQDADQAYADGRYERAIKLYERLVQAGDKFSAFRLASMYEDGLGVEQDLVEAYAWSYLAAERGREAFKHYNPEQRRQLEKQRKAFRGYNLQLREQLGEQQLEPARIRAGELIRQYGTLAYARKARDTIRNMRFKCAGSRVGNTCDKVDVSWVGCAITAEYEPSMNCLILGSLSMNSYKSMPAEVRNISRDLSIFIDNYQPGIVELGDFELVDEDTRPDQEQ